MALLLRAQAVERRLARPAMTRTTNRFSDLHEL